MIGLDTNVLVRYFAQDDPVQSRKSREWIESKLSEDEPGFVSLVTIAELVWVLSFSYGLTDRKIAGVIERMLQADVLDIQNHQEVFQAMEALKASRGGFTDVLIGAIGAWAGCRMTLTFDKKAARLDGFRLLA